VELKRNLTLPPLVVWLTPCVFSLIPIHLLQMANRDVKEREELSSWKEIAEFLGVSVRTAQRWETEMALPVRRVGGEKGRTVAAYADELKNWKTKHAPSSAWWNSPQVLRNYAIVVTIWAVSLSAYVASNLAAKLVRGQPANAYWRGATLVASDSKDRELWRRTFPHDPSPHYAWQFLGDINRDGQVEVIVPFIPDHVMTRDSLGGFLVCLSSKGQEVWKLQPSRVVADRKRKYSDVYVLRAAAVFPSPDKDGSLWTAATFANNFDYPSVAVVVDGNGKLRGEYWHSGHLDYVATQDLDLDGVEELLLAGMTLGRNQAVVRIFDPRQVSGADTLPAGHPNQLLGLSEGTEKATVILPRTRLNRKIAHHNWAYFITPAKSGASDRSWQVSVREFIEGASYLVYSIRPDLSLASVTASDALRNFYLERSVRVRDTEPFSDRDLAELQRDYQVEIRGR
jgi:hypothetical protein